MPNEHDQASINRVQSFPIEFTISSALEQPERNDFSNEDNEYNNTFSADPSTENNNIIINQEQTLDSSGINTTITTITTSVDSVAVQTSFSIWNPFTWLSSSSNAIEEIEMNILNKTKWPVKRYFVNIRNKSMKIWTISANTDNQNIPIVLVHGFCGGVAMWVHNIDPLCENRPFYAFDLLGFGRSSRPKFSTDPIVAEQQFVESIEDWRKAMSLEKFILFGHSFGGYLSAAYALKYPQYVTALLLVDPWGFPEVPAAKPDTPTPLWISTIAKVSQYVSPLSIFRLTGQVGVAIFKHLRPDFKRKYMSILDDPEIIYSYLYHANNQNPSGEAGFRAIAHYFGYAKNPMIKRIDKVANNIPIWFIYGSRSWIDPSSGFLAMVNRQDSVLTSVKLITGAGHHVYADKPEEFNEYVKYILELIDEHEKTNQDYPNLNNQNPSSCSSSPLMPDCN